MVNVEIVIRREPSAAELREAGLPPDADLFGLYVGTPHPERGGYQLTLPDRIVIYQGPLERAAVGLDARERRAGTDAAVLELERGQRRARE